MSKPKMLPQFTLIVNPFFVALLFTQVIRTKRMSWPVHSSSELRAQSELLEWNIFTLLQFFFSFFFVSSWDRGRRFFNVKSGLGNELKYAAEAVIQLIFDWPIFS